MKILSVIAKALGIITDGRWDLRFGGPVIDYQKFIEELSKHLRWTPSSIDVSAAVALVFRISERGIEILFVKRVRSDNDPWSGQMAFPGGKREEKDVDLRATAIREAYEETCLDLPKYCTYVGAMKPMRTLTPGVHLDVVPFVFLLRKSPPEIRLNKELERFAWISLGRLRSVRSSVEFAFGKTPAYMISDEDIIWGLTYRIVEKFFEMIKTICGNDYLRSNF